MTEVDKFISAHPDAYSIKNFILHGEILSSETSLDVLTYKIEDIVSKLPELLLTKDYSILIEIPWNSDIVNYITSVKSDVRTTIVLKYNNFKNGLCVEYVISENNDDDIIITFKGTNGCSISNIESLRYIWDDNFRKFHQAATSDIEISDKPYCNNIFLKRLFIDYIYGIILILGFFSIYETARLVCIGTPVDKYSIAVVLLLLIIFTISRINIIYKK